MLRKVKGIKDVVDMIIGSNYFVSLQQIMISVSLHYCRTVPIKVCKRYVNLQLVSLDAIFYRMLYATLQIKLLLHPFSPTKLSYKVRIMSAAGYKHVSIKLSLELKM